MPKFLPLPFFLLIYIITALLISFQPSKAQYNNIYTEDSWEKRDEWQRPEIIIEQLELNSGMNVADIGCHEGYMSIKLADHVGPEGMVYAVDVNSSRLKNLNNNLEERSIENVEIIKGDYSDPKLPNNTLDAVLILDTYHEISKPQEVLSHIKSSLKHNGILVIIDPIRESLRGDKRSNQVQKHELELRYAKKDLENAGFKILKEMDPFIDRTEPKGDKLWLLVAIKE